MSGRGRIQTKPVWWRVFTHIWLTRECFGFSGPTSLFKVRQYHPGDDLQKQGAHRVGGGTPEEESFSCFQIMPQMTHLFLSLCSKSSGLNPDISDLGTHWSPPQGGCPSVSRHRSVQALFHLGTYYWSKLQFDILLLFTSALIIGWGKECLRFAKNLGNFF